MSDSTISPSRALSPPPISVGASLSPTSLPPTTTSSPSETPSTASPTVSHKPTISPKPTGVQSSPPTLSPVLQPSHHPSGTDIYSAQETYFQDLQVTESREFDELEVGIYEFLMESYTGNIGVNQTDPFVVTKCTLTDQKVGSLGSVQARHLKGSIQTHNSRETQETSPTYVLSLTFSMNYTSHYGVNVQEEGWDYPSLFLQYLTANQTQIAVDMQTLYLPVDSVILTYKALYPSPPTNSPTQTLITSPPTVSPTTVSPTPFPSISPTGSPTLPIKDGSHALAFALGIIFGVLGACVISYCMYRRFMRSKLNPGDAGPVVVASEEQSPQPTHNNDTGEEVGVATAVPAEEKAEDETKETAPPQITGHQVALNEAMMGLPAITTPRDEEEQVVEPASTTTAPSYNTIDSMITLGSVFNTESPSTSSAPLSPNSQWKTSSDAVFSGTNLMVTREDSYSSESYDEMIAPQKSIESNPDEFDKYKNDLLEKLRYEVEGSIEDVDGMMSLAMTKVLIEADGELDLSWVGAEDLGSIEASCFCETFEWRKANDLDTAHHFFEDMLNRIVLIVHHGIVRPHDGARILQGCASVLGMNLLREIPNTTILIQGLRKSNDLAQGHHFLAEEFSPFGDIIDASISPNNRGFGFVRFVTADSVDKVLHKYRTSEIEIQDVAVIVTTLKAR